MQDSHVSNKDPSSEGMNYTSDRMCHQEVRIKRDAVIWTHALLHGKRITCVTSGSLTTGPNTHSLSWFRMLFCIIANAHPQIQCDLKSHLRAQLGSVAMKYRPGNTAQCQDVNRSQRLRCHLREHLGAFQLSQPLAIQDSGSFFQEAPVSIIA